MLGSLDYEFLIAAFHSGLQFAHLGSVSQRSIAVELETVKFSEKELPRRAGIFKGIDSDDKGSTLRQHPDHSHRGAPDVE